MTSAERTASRICLAVFWAVQLIRITHGIDFNDEMQYYGEISALVSTGRLFSNDLFLQQLVYVPFYPLFKIFAIAGGGSGLVIFSRALLACVLAWVYRSVRRSLAATGTPPLASAVAAFTATLAISIHNIYSLSYNTVGLSLSAVLFAEFNAWRVQPVRAERLALVIGAMGFAYPPLAVTSLAAVCARLWMDRDFPALQRTIVWIAGLGAVSAVLTATLISLPDLQAALAFSSSAHIGDGAANLHPLLLLLAVVAAGTAATQHEIFARARAQAWFWPLMLAFATTVAVYATRWFYYSSSRTAGLTLFALCLAASGAPAHSDSRRRQWLAALFLAMAATFILTSSGGFEQVYAPACIAAAFLGAMAVKRNSTDGATARIAAWIALGSVGTALTVHAVRNPYHDGPIWKQTARVVTVPWLRGVAITPEKAAAILAMQRTLADIPARSRVLVLGSQPWIYMAMDAVPDTDMLFMHTVVPPAGYEIVAKRLETRRPEFIVAANVLYPELARAFDALKAAGAYTCEARAIDAALTDAPQKIQVFFNFAPAMIVCRRER